MQDQMTVAEVGKGPETLFDWLLCGDPRRLIMYERQNPQSIDSEVLTLAKKLYTGELKKEELSKEDKAKLDDAAITVLKKKVAEKSPQKVVRPWKKFVTELPLEVPQAEGFEQLAPFWWL